MRRLLPIISVLAAGCNNDPIEALCSTQTYVLDDVRPTNNPTTAGAFKIWRVDSKARFQQETSAPAPTSLNLSGKAISIEIVSGDAQETIVNTNERRIDVFSFSTFDIDSSLFSITPSTFTEFFVATNGGIVKPTPRSTQPQYYAQRRENDLRFVLLSTIAFGFGSPL